MDDFIRSVNNASNINKGKTDGTIWMTSLGVYITYLTFIKLKQTELYG